MAAKTGADPIGVPYDPHDRYPVVEAFCKQIEAGDHDAILDDIETQAKGRRQRYRRIDEDGHRRQFPAGIESKDLLVQIVNGWFSLGYPSGIEMILETVRYRRSVLKADAARAKQEELRASAPRLVNGMRVRVRPDVPLTPAGQPMLGKYATVKRVKQVKSVIVFDPNQPGLGKWATPSGVNMDNAWLEVVDDTTPQPFDLAPADAATLADLVNLECERLAGERDESDGDDATVDARLEHLFGLIERLRSHGK